MKQLILSAIIVIIVLIIPIPELLANHGFLILLMFALAVVGILIIYLLDMKKH